MSHISSNDRFFKMLTEVGAPLLAIAAWTTHAGVPVGAMSTIYAAVLAATAVQVLRHFLLRPVLAYLQVDNDVPLRFVATLTLNAALGLACAIFTAPTATLPL